MRARNLTFPLIFMLVAVISLCKSSNVKFVNPLIGTDNVYPGNGNYAGMIPTTGVSINGVL